MDTAELIRHAERGMRGRDPEHGFPIEGGHLEAIPYLLLVLVREQQAFSTRLVDMNATLNRLAAALEQRNEPPEPAPAPAVEPKPRWWRRRRGDR